MKKKVSDYLSDSADTLDSAKQATQSTAAAVQDRVKDAVQAGLVAAKASLAKAQDVAQSDLPGKTQDALQTGLTKAQSAAQSGLSMAQDAVQAGLVVAQGVAQSGAAKKAQDSMSAGLDTAQDTLESVQKGAQKNLKRMQKSAAKNLKSMQKQAKSVQKQAKKNLKSMQEGAQSNLSAAQKNIQQAGGAMQAKRAQASRRRWRRKMTFRLGLLAGVVLALLYTPKSGSEMRRQLASFWQRISVNLQKMPEMLSSGQVNGGVRAKETRPTRQTTPSR